MKTYSIGTSTFYYKKFIIKDDKQSIFSKKDEPRFFITHQLDTIDDFLFK